MKNQEIVKKLWNYAGTLRNSGVSNQSYLSELTYLLFLKMSKEQEQEDAIPEEYRWDSLLDKEGESLLNYYNKLLLALGDPNEVDNPKINAIYYNAHSSIRQPQALQTLISNIDKLDWFSAREEGLGNLYEGLMQRSAEDTKSGAGQYFTPRVLIDMMVRMSRPKIGERLNDPAAGTFGFMVAADQYLKDQTDDYFDLNEEEHDFQVHRAFSGMELVPETRRLAMMNEYLHGMDGDLRLGNSLSAEGKWMKNFDLVLTNPPFGTSSEGSGATRDDITYKTSNKQLNFLQIIYNSLKSNGHARAAVVVPDNVLFADGIGEDVRLDLMNKCNLHTILRLPTGIFYAQGVQTNVLFFDRGIDDEDNTKDVWIYDMRHQMRTFGKRNPLNKKDFVEFEKLYCPDDRSQRQETYDADKNPLGRWRKYSIEDIKKRPNTNLDISWMSDEEEKDERTLSEILEDMQVKSQAIEQAMDRLTKELEGIEDLGK